MKTNEFIEKEVQEYRLGTEKKENETKEQFFKYLLLGYSVSKFRKWLSKKWDDSDIKKMKIATSTLEKLVDKTNKTENQGKTQEFFSIVPYKRFRELKKDFSEECLEYYKKRLEIASKVPNKAEYLKEFVDKYDKYMANVPYFRNGKVYSWHTLSDYTAMIYNTNLTRTGWNRTFTDAEKAGTDLLYLPAHPYACPHCLEWQGKYYQAQGKGKYPSIQKALDGGVGHPNCKHVPVPAFDDEQRQDDLFNSAEWEEKYKLQQKLLAIERQKEKLRTDLSIYKNLGDQTNINLIKAKIKKLNEKSREIKSSL